MGVGEAGDGGGVVQGEKGCGLCLYFDTATETDRLLRWWWSHPFTLNIHPSSQITVPDFVRRRIREVLDWPDDQVKASALREARDACPHHPLVLLCLAEQGNVVRTVLCAVTLLANENRTGDCADHLRRAALPHPFSPAATTPSAPPPAPTNSPPASPKTATSPPASCNTSSAPNSQSKSSPAPSSSRPTMPAIAS